MKLNNCDEIHPSAWLALSILAVCSAGSMWSAWEMHEHTRVLKEHEGVLREYMGMAHNNIAE